MFLLAACSISESVEDTTPPVSEVQARLSADYSLDIPEPSGLTLSVDGNYLWTVSDQTKLVYKISLDGKTIRHLSFEGDDLEGVVQSPLDSTLWVVEEQRREIVQLDTLGNELRRIKINVEKRESNSGLEGIAFDNRQSSFYVLNEKNPALFIQLNAQFAISETHTIDFAEDYAGLTYDAAEDVFWLISDQSAVILKIDSAGQVLLRMPLGITKMEGIAVDRRRNRIYTVNDAEGKLYWYELPNIK